MEDRTMAKTNIDVTLVYSFDSDSNKLEASLPDDEIVGALTLGLVNLLQLPTENAVNSVIYYYLSVKRVTMIRLNEESTLEQAGVQNGDTLRLDRVSSLTDYLDFFKKPVMGDVSNPEINSICPTMGWRCGPPKKMDDKFVFVAASTNKRNNDIYSKAIKPTLTKYGYRCKNENEEDDEDKREGSKWIICKVCRFIQKAAFNIVDITNFEANTLFELGMMFGMRKPVILLKHEKIEASVSTLPPNLHALCSLDIIPYGDVDELKEKLSNKLKKREDASRHRDENKACAYCHEDFKPFDEPVYCVEDLIPHHQECWGKNGGCVVCKNTRCLKI
jgi:hypothetical protein